MFDHLRDCPLKDPSKRKTQKRKFKVPYATKNKEKKIPSEKVSLSSAEKSVSVANEEKLCTDNIIPINIYMSGL